MDNHTLKKIRGKSYSSHCRDCNFSDCGETYNIVAQAKKHAEKYNHSVEYYTENGKVFVKN